VANSTFSSGFGDIAGGGGIVNIGTLSVTNSTFSVNAAFGGGGAIANGGTLRIANSTFSENSAGHGSSINNGATMTVINCTFSGNKSRGGVIGNGGTLTVINSTFSSNSGGAGGIENFGTLAVTSSTFSGNIVFQGVLEGGGGTIYNNAGGAIIKNTIVSGTSLFGGGRGDNCSGTVTDAGYNISDDTSCGFAKTGSATNGDGVNPLFAAAGLADNGGPTQTIALGSESPAIDAIPLADCTDQASPPKRITTDQRGMPRPDFGEDICDISAYESQETFAGQPGATNCHGVSVSALSDQFGSIKAAALALGFPSVQALQNAIRAFCRR
jgi:Right handed beta helix region